MERLRVAGACLLALAFLTGCWEEKKTVSLNPDGTGKMEVQVLFAPFSLDFSGGRQPSDFDAGMRKAVKEILEMSRGIEVWSDVSFRRAEDGRIFFSGTAYFTDLSQVQLHNLGFGNFSVTKDGEGRMVLEVKAKKKEGGEKPPPAPTPAFSEEEIRKRVADAKSSYQMMRPMLVGFFSTIKEEARFFLPGTVAESHNFVREESGAVTIKLDGAKLVKVIDEMMADDAFLRKAVASPGFTVGGGFDLPADDLLIVEKLFGEKAPVKVVIAGPFSPRFDYAAEVEKAKESFPSLLSSLGIDLPHAQDGSGALLQAKSFRVTGVSTSRDPDGQAFYRVSLAGEVSKPVLGVTGGVLKAATTDSGESILPEEWNRAIRFVQVSSDGNALSFSVALSFPPRSAKAIREISGTLECVMPSGEAATEDLGISHFREGAKGTRYQAEIVSLERVGGTGKSHLNLRVGLPREIIKEVVFKDAEGTKLKVRLFGYSSDGNTTELRYVAETSLPETGGISAVVYKETVKRTLPFSVGNVSLLGEPL